MLSGLGQRLQRDRVGGRIAVKENLRAQRGLEGFAAERPLLKQALDASASAPCEIRRKQGARIAVVLELIVFGFVVNVAEQRLWIGIRTLRARRKLCERTVVPLRRGPSQRHYRRAPPQTWPGPSECASSLKAGRKA